MTTRDDIRAYFNQAVAESQAFMLMVTDKVTRETYAVYTSADEFQAEYDKRDGVNMQRIMEVYDLSLDRETQIGEARAWHFPAR